MIYVVDTNVFSTAFKHIKFTAFRSFWLAFDDMMDKNLIISVREVYNELKSFFISTSKDNNSEIAKWLKKHKNSFITPTNEECYYVQKIFENKHFQQLVKKQSIIDGSPEADAFLIAKAITCNGVLVTNEKYKENSSKIPNVCEKFNVSFIEDSAFFEIINNYYEENLRDSFTK